MAGVDVIGVAMTSFGRHEDRTVRDLAMDAASGALRDAGLAASEVDAVVFANAGQGLLDGQEMIRGQVALRGLGLSGVPLFNVENACASGGSAFHLAETLILGGRADVVLTVGAEKLVHPDKARSFAAIRAGTDLSLSDGEGPSPASGSVMMATYAAQARAYSAAWGSIGDALCAVAVKNRSYAVDNPLAQFREPIDADAVASSREVADPLTLLMCSPLSDGAAAVVLRAGGPRTGPAPVRPVVSVLASAATSFLPGSSTVGRAATIAYRSADLAPSEVDVFAVHDACAFAEMVQWEEVGLCDKGQGRRLALDGGDGPLGRLPVNTDGGLLSRGHPLGATGLAQLVELTTQLRGDAGARQVAGARVGLAINGGGWMGPDYAATTCTVLGR